MQSESLYARLELLTPEQIQNSRLTQPTSPTTPVAAARWQRWNRALWRSLIGSQEPRITLKHDRAGQAFYEVYDPVSRARHVFNSDHEVRVWLDERYYQ